MKLVVIEGLGKVKTIEKYLGKGYKVFATKGHIRDLPAKSLAVNVKKNFEPKYDILPDKKDIVKELISLSEKADEIYLATDPDREGEAISWHIAHVLNIPEDKKARVVFNEISQKAVKHGLENPREIDLNLVDAQQARRVLDRLVGYKLSPILCKKIKSNLSAGRVQSVTLRIVVDREREIRAFKPEEYWTFAVKLDKDKTLVLANLAKKQGKKIKLGSKEDVDEVINGLSGSSYVVKSVKKSVTKSHAPAPFITSSMQQDALNKLGLSLKQSSSAAQTLYEGVEIPGEGKVALITYIRTDSTRVSSDAIKSAREFIGEKFGEKYVPEKANIYASKKSAQDAHEAIRPISLNRTPDSVKSALQPAQYKLYKLIYERFLASQMSEALYNSVNVEIEAAEYLFTVKGKTPLFAGYTAVYNNYVDDSSEEEGDAKLPELTEGDILKFIEYKYEQKFTKPPARFTEASLVKVMEEKGIGRPATYVPTITLLGMRKYIEKEGKYLIPTKLGEEVTDLLIRYFSDIMDIGFTAAVETKLDGIEYGGKVWQNVVADFYGDFEREVEIAAGDSFSLKAAPVITDVKCALCGANMVIREGKNGKFLACPNFPKCKYTQPLDGGEEQSKPKPEVTDVVCEKCGRPMVIRNGRYGPFLGCSGYPECKNIKPLEGGVAEKESFGNCPKCGKPLRKIATRKGIFYGCTGYPDCSFTAYNPVSDKKCPKCGGYMMLKTAKDGKKTLVCANKECGYSEEQNDN